MKKRHIKKEWKNTVCFSFGIAVVAVLLSFLPPLQDLEKKIFNQQMILRGPVDVSESPIVIIEISQEADEEIPYQYPWPRWIYGKLIENLNKAGARVIAIDVLFDQRDQNPAYDSTFADALRGFDNVILIGGFRRTQDFADDGIIIDKTSRVMPNRVLEEAMPNPVGMVEMRQDKDGFIRSYPFGTQFMDEQLQSLAIQTLMVKEDINQNEVINNPDIFSVGRYAIPKNKYGMMYINYYGGSRSFPFIGFEKIIDDEDFDTRMEMEAFPVNEFSDPEFGILARGVLEDKIVFVGATMPELQDYHLVPFEWRGEQPVMAGVEIHAHALQTILDENYLTDLPFYYTLILTLFIAFLLYEIVRRFRVWPGVIVTISIIIFISAGSYFLFDHLGIIASAIPLYLASAGAYITGNVKNYLAEQKEKQRITSMFSSYVSPELVDRLVTSKEDFKLAGETKTLTVLFSDIANFSSLAESVSAEKVVVFMNEYLNMMTKIITNENGTLDKYIGDAVMAFYGAPVSLRSHAIRACRSALRMQKASSELNDSKLLKDEISPDFKLHTRIGINTGEMVVGNMGSEQRFNYTVMGDNVNIGARCEVACKDFGIGIITTMQTKREADKGEFIFRQLGKMRVKGRSAFVDIYQLACFADDVNLHVIEMVEIFEKALDHYMNKEWKQAADLFEKTEKIEKDLNYPVSEDINPSKFYLKRCNHFLTYPPPENWDGTLEQQVK